MVLPPLAPPPHLVAALAQRPNPQYTLELRAEGFVVGDGARRETVPRGERAPEAKADASFRRDGRWAVWDARGLTTRDRDWTATDRLAAIPVSPRLQSREEIAATLAKARTGERSRAASGLSGARRIGKLVYLLPRWDDANGKPWLEALVVVDLGRPHPKARLLGRFGGLSLGRGPVDDRLGIEGGLLRAAVNAEGAWGFATYDPVRGRFAFAPRGVRLLALEEDRTRETTAYGTTLAGRQADGRTVPWLETRGPAEFVAGAGPVLVRCGDRLRNAASGAELRLAPDAAVRRTRFGLLVFWPEKAPRSARLVEPTRMEERARWEKGTK